MPGQIRLRDGNPEETPKPKKDRAKEFLAATKRSTVKESAGETSEVDLDEEDDDEGEEVEADAAPARSRPSKRNRYAEQRERADNATRELEELKRAREIDQVRLENATRYANGVQQMLGSGGQPQKDKYDVELDALRKEEESLVNAFQAKRAALPQGQDLPQEEWEKLRAARFDLTNRQQRVNAEKVLSGRPQGPNAEQIKADVVAQQLLEKYPDVFGDRQKAAYAANIYNAHRIKNPEATDAMDVAVDETRKAYGLTASRPSNVQRSRLVGAGVTSMSSASGATQRKLTLTPDMQRIAERRYKNLPPEEAHKKWAKRIGPALLAKENG